MAKPEDKPDSGFVSDRQYVQELRDLEVERDERLAELDATVEAALRRRDGKEAPFAERHETLLERIAITQHFWRASQEARFDCRVRHWKQTRHGPGRPPKHFRWFRMVPTRRKLRSGPRPNEEEAVIVDLVLTRMATTGERRRPRNVLVDALLNEMSSDAATTRRYLEKLRTFEETSRSSLSASAKALRSLDPKRFDRLERAIQRVMKQRRK